MDDHRTAWEDNYRAALRHFARHGAPPAVVEDDGGVLRMASAVRIVGSFFTVAVRTDPSVDAGDVVDAARAFGLAHRRAVAIWGAEDLDADLGPVARDAGAAPGPSLLGMRVDRPPTRTIRETPFPEGPRSAGAEVRRVTSAADAAAFAAVHRPGFRALGLPAEAVDHFASPGSLLHPDVTAFVGLVDGEPVSAAMALVDGAVGGIYWVATRGDRRGQGLGTALTRAATEAAFDRGTRSVVLQATGLGEPVYRRLGFTPFTTYRTYVLPEPGSAAPARPDHRLNGEG